LAEAKIVVVNAILFWYIWGRGFVPAEFESLADRGAFSVYDESLRRQKGKHEYS
jgi:hypothetical protein